MAETVLAFDTSAAHCAAALLLPGGRVLTRLEPMEKGQAERLMPLLEAVLAEGAARWRDLAAVGVGTGPGNFTGVRIAVAAARGIALGLGVPAIGAGLLEARAEGLARPLAVIEDARRGEVYLQEFGLGADEGPRLCDLSDLAPLLGAVALAGSAAGAAAALTGGAVLPPALPLGVAVARIAAARLGTTQPRPAPLYLRAPDARPQPSGA